MNLQERAQSTLEIEFPSATSIQAGLIEAENRLYVDTKEWQILQDQLIEIQQLIYEVEYRIGDSERAYNLFNNALDEQDQLNEG